MMRTGSFRAFALFVSLFVPLVLCFAPGASAQDLVRDFAETYTREGTPSALPRVDPADTVAFVDAARVTAGDVLELWTPIWSETQARVRNGRLDPREGDRRLQIEWEKAVTALVKDEVFFQEADREHSSTVNRYVDMIMRGSEGVSRSEVAARVRREVDADMQRYFRELNSDIVRESGGMIKLSKVLESRGMSFTDWQNRLRKKAFTQSYLHMILSPRAPEPGPRQVQEYYAAHPEEFSSPGTVRFRHIFFSNAARGEDEAREDAAAVWEMIAGGEISFEEAARTYSDDVVSKGNGGLETSAEAEDLEREAWLSDIRAALREEKAGGLGPILESPFGCHVATLVSIGEGRRVPFSEVRARIERKLAGAVWDEETDKYFRSIARGTPIRIVRRTFPEHLSCAAQMGGGGGPTVVHTALPEIRSAPRGR